jgi:hypothetical protein
VSRGAKDHELQHGVLDRPFRYISCGSSHSTDGAVPYPKYSTCFNVSLGKSPSFDSSASRARPWSLLPHAVEPCPWRPCASHVETKRKCLGAQERGLTFVIRMCRFSHPSPSPYLQDARGEARDRVAAARCNARRTWDKDMVGRQPAEMDE